MGDAESRHYDARDECRDCHTLSAFNLDAKCGDCEPDDDPDEDHE